MTAKALVRWTMVATSGRPFTPAYEALYRGLVQLAVRRLKRFPGVHAIYLRRGLAGGQLVPGVSDIDLAVIGDLDASTEAHISRSHRRLARLCPLYDPRLETYTPQSMRLLFETDPIRWHFLAEGQRSWKLLFGEDRLSQLGNLDPVRAAIGCEAEIKLWWTHFARVAFGPAQGSDPVFERSICVKAVAECLALHSRLRGSPPPATRRAALEAAARNAEGQDAAFLSRLLGTIGSRYLHYRGDIIQDTCDFLLPLLNRVFTDLDSHPAWSAAPGVSASIDGLDSDGLDSDGPDSELPHDVSNFVASLAEQSNRLSPGKWQSIAPTSGVAFAMDEVVLLFTPRQGWLPRLSELREIARICAAASASLRSRVSLYIALPACACQFYASDYFLGWQSMLSPSSNPDAMLRDRPIAWTEPVAAFVHQELLLLVSALDDPAVYKANTLDFLRMFWTFLELATLERGVARGAVVFTKTPEAVIRCLDRLNLPCAPYLEQFAQSYKSELRGVPAEIGRSIPPAIRYLKEIYYAP